MSMQMKTEDVCKAIEKNYASIKDLPPEKYAEPGGWAEQVVQSEGNSLKATQLRKIFHYIKDLQREFQKNDFNRSKVVLIMPQLAYAVGRKHISEPFYNLIKLCFGSRKCQSKEDFDNAVNFLEAIMAYHKYYEQIGKEGERN